MAKNLTDKMKTDLSLTEEQYSQVLPVNQDFISQMKALKSSGDSKLSKFKQMKSMDKNRDDKLKQILTSEQYEVFLKNKAENRKKLKEAVKNRDK